MACLSEEELLPATMGEGLPPEAESHLEECSACRERLDHLRSTVVTLRQAAVQVATASDAGPRPLPRPEARPTTIGKYLVVGLLGKGAQSIVYRVIHPELGKDMALKLCAARLDQGDPDRELLVREARLLAQLEHPNLVRIYDLDFHDGRPFFAMEYLTGRTLDQVRRHENVPWRQAVEWIEQLARALAQVHPRGIVHQDIKPSNILIDADSRARLLDFGLARLRTAFSADGWQPLGGTAAYMAPEQARGEWERLGPTSDIFALGGVLYFLLTGREPFSGTTWNEARERAARCEFDRGPLVNCAAPRWLKEACLKAMAPTPENRFAAAAEFAQALAQGGRPSLPRRWLAAAAVLLVVAIGGWVVVQPRHPTGPSAGNGNVKRVEGFAVAFETVLRDKKAYGKVDDVLPLQAGDHIRLLFKTPQMPVSALWFSSDGTIQELKPLQPAGEGKFVYPSESKFAPVDDKAGTELVLVGGGSAGPLRARDVLAKLPLGKPLPVLPENLMVYMDCDGVHLVVEGDILSGRLIKRGSGPPVQLPLTDLEQQLDDLRLYLRERYPFFAALAFAHGEKR